MENLAEEEAAANGRQRVNDLAVSTQMANGRAAKQGRARNRRADLGPNTIIKEHKVKSPVRRTMNRVLRVQKRKRTKTLNHRARRAQPPKRTKILSHREPRVRPLELRIPIVIRHKHR